MCVDGDQEFPVLVFILPSELLVEVIHGGCCRVLLIAVLVTVFAAPTASAGTGTPISLSKTLGELWTTVLELPSR